MKILFYSTNSIDFKDAHLDFFQYPKTSRQINALCLEHPDVQFIVAAQPTGKFLKDESCALTDSHLQKEQDLLKASPKNLLQYTIPCEDLKSQVEFLADLKPDKAIAASIWEKPFDWHALKDAMIAEELSKKGFSCIASDPFIQYMSFNKYETHRLLEPLGIKMPKCIKVDHNLYFCAANRKEIKVNVYKEYILSRIKQMHYPLIIKDTTGLSSYGMEVVQNYGEACAYLNSKKHSSDRIIEELISGTQFGLEIWAGKNFCTVLDPFIFSTNKYGITSPKQSIKLGPVTDEKFKITELKNQMHKMAEAINLKGPCQVDLVFDGTDWYVLELNPRLSGMTSTYAACAGTDVIHMLYALASENFIPEKTFCKKMLNIKFKLLDKDTLKKLSKENGIEFIYQIENKDARQEREKGYCEIILNQQENKEILFDLIKKFPDIAEESFIEKAVNLIKEVQL